MLIPSTAVRVAVTAMKMTDLISGPAMDARFMAFSPQDHGDAPVQRPHQEAAPAGDGCRGTAECEAREFPDQFAVLRCATRPRDGGRGAGRGGGCGGLAARAGRG